MAEVKSFKEFVMDEREELAEAARRSLSRVMNHVQKNAVGFITAHRGEFAAGGRDDEGRTNKERNHALAKDIHAAGFGYIHVRGRYVENYGTKDSHPVDEHSFMVTAGREHAVRLHDFLTKHGEKYGQDSVAFKHPDRKNAVLVGTREGAFPGKGKEHDLGEFHANRVPEFHSLMTRGGGKLGQTPANKRSFAFMTPDKVKERDLREATDVWGGIWESFGFFNPISNFSRQESPF